MVFLRNLNTEDVEFRVNLLNNPAVNEYLNVNEVFTCEKTKEWLAHLDTRKRYDCVFVSNECSIGMGGLTNISASDKNAELYMYLDPQFQGHGLGYKSLVQLCKYGFDVLNLEKIYLYTFADNVRANKLYEKAGFKHEGCLRLHKMHKGSLVDRNIYGLLNNEFEIK